MEKKIEKRSIFSQTDYQRNMYCAVNKLTEWKTPAKRTFTIKLIYR
jgi:hypothetical protein